ncbi:MAG TPA: hypothetical protein VLL25_16960 [Acidimicrobiales bacterium]|nr:hypothetical protein [Acidimicrobiales bacterium]
MDGPLQHDARGVHGRATVTGKTFFPHLISAPFMSGLRIAFTFSLILFLVAAVASWLRGDDQPAAVPAEETLEARTDAVEAEVLTA